jgi:outer membrane protein OmpA-like peptidoglycan-associated protein
MKGQRSDEWISISDMMAGLMMIFLLIAVAFMYQTDQERKAMADIAVEFERSRDDLNQALRDEFRADLPVWGAEILDDNTFRFNEPQVLFARNSAEINDKFKVILSDFFPRYLAILSRDEFRSEIDEVRVEGHTSSDWRGASNSETAYIKNARLSQNRSFSVLDYIHAMPASDPHRSWLQKVLRANGVSSAKPIVTSAGVEDVNRSRRVEFRVITKTEERIFRILREAENLS